MSAVQIGSPASSGPAFLSFGFRPFFFAGAVLEAAGCWLKREGMGAI